jgi:hypothetical protein
MTCANWPSVRWPEQTGLKDGDWRFCALSFFSQHRYSCEVKGNIAGSHKGSDKYAGKSTIKQKETYVKLIARLIVPNRTSCVRGRKEFAEVAKESGVQWYGVGCE